MKKKILVLLLAVFVLGLTACGKKVTLDEIVEKFNNCDTVKTYKEYGFDISASANKDAITITSVVGEETSKVEFKLEGNILSNENITINDSIAALVLVDSIGQVYGYKDGELAQNINAFSEEFEKYSINKEGLELVLNDDKVSIKVNLSKKIPLISMDNFYLKADDLDIISEIIADKSYGNQSGKTGNIAYDVFVGDEESTIQIGQEGKLSDSAYKSIISALEVMYGEDVAKHFQEIYPKFIDGTKTVEAFTIETNYKLEDQDEGVFKDTEVVLVTIKNSDLK